MPLGFCHPHFMAPIPSRISLFEEEKKLSLYLCTEEKKMGRKCYLIRN
jgi:hypothetical protein